MAENDRSDSRSSVAINLQNGADIQVTEFDIDLKSCIDALCDKICQLLQKDIPVEKKEFLKNLIIHQFEKELKKNTMKKDNEIEQLKQQLASKVCEKCDKGITEQTRTLSVQAWEEKTNKDDVDPQVAIFRVKRDELCKMVCELFKTPNEFNSLSATNEFCQCVDSIIEAYDKKACEVKSFKYLLVDVDPERKKKEFCDKIWKFFKAKRYKGIEHDEIQHVREYVDWFIDAYEKVARGVKFCENTLDDVDPQVKIFRAECIEVCNNIWELFKSPAHHPDFKYLNATEHFCKLYEKIVHKVNSSKNTWNDAEPIAKKKELCDEIYNAFQKPSEEKIMDTIRHVSAYIDWIIGVYKKTICEEKTCKNTLGSTTVEDDIAQEHKQELENTNKPFTRSEREEIDGSQTGRSQFRFTADIKCHYACCGYVSLLCLLNKNEIRFCAFKLLLKIGAITRHKPPSCTKILNQLRQLLFLKKVYKWPDDNQVGRDEVLKTVAKKLKLSGQKAGLLSYSTDDFNHCLTVYISEEEGRLKIYDADLNVSYIKNFESANFLELIVLRCNKNGEPLIVKQWGKLCHEKTCKEELEELKKLSKLLKFDHGDDTGGVSSEDNVGDVLDDKGIPDEPLRKDNSGDGLEGDNPHAVLDDDNPGDGLERDNPLAVLDEDNPGDGLEGHNPHAVLDEDNPGDGLEGDNPHAVLDEDNPGDGLKGDNPHAVLDEDNPGDGLEGDNPHSVLDEDNPGDGLEGDNPHAVLDVGNLGGVLVKDNPESVLDVGNVFGVEDENNVL